MKNRARRLMQYSLIGAKLHRIVISIGISSRTYPNHSLCRRLEEKRSVSQFESRRESIDSESLLFMFGYKSNLIQFNCAASPIAIRISMGIRASSVTNRKQENNARNLGSVVILEILVVDESTIDDEFTTFLRAPALGPFESESTKSLISFRLFENSARLSVAHTFMSSGIPIAFTFPYRFGRVQ